MKKDDLVYVKHICESIILIQSYMNGVSIELFINDQMRQDAVTRNFEIIGEASRKISLEFKNKNTNILWREMNAMRNFLIHEYDEVDLNVLWETVQMRLPALKIQIENLLNEK